MEVKEFFNKNFTYALIGASNNKEKYGNVILLNLKEAGYNVVPINPKEELIEGLKAYPNLQAYKDNIDVVVFVVPPSITLSVLKSLPQNIDKVWMQPGSSNEECVVYCKEHKLHTIHDMCVMVEKPR